MTDDTILLASAQAAEPVTIAHARFYRPVLRSALPLNSRRRNPDPSVVDDRREARAAPEVERRRLDVGAVDRPCSAVPPRTNRRRAQIERCYELDLLHYVVVLPEREQVALRAYRGRRRARDPEQMPERDPPDSGQPAPEL